MAEPPREPKNERGRTTRREALKGAGVVGTLALFVRARVGSAEHHVQAATKGGTRFLRPPGAVEESDFVKRCIRCHKCGENCTNACIKRTANAIATFIGYFEGSGSEASSSFKTHQVRRQCFT